MIRSVLPSVGRLLTVAALGALALPAAAQPGARPWADHSADGPLLPGPAGPPVPESGLIDGGTAPAARTAVVAPPWGQLVGQTQYDLQTNAAAPRRVTVDNGRVATVWTQICPNASSPTVAPRGIGYNRTEAPGAAPVVSGTTCNTSFGIAAFRTGWPELLRIGGQDVVFAHTGRGLVQISRPTDTSQWVTSAVLPFTDTLGGNPRHSAMWVRAAGSGATVHLLYSATDALNGSTLPALYSRSSDGGLTWDRRNVELPGLDTLTVRNAADAYAIAAHGNTVAVAAGAFASPTMLALSYDGGATFTSYRITPPITDADTVLVTTFAGAPQAVCAVVPDGSMSLVVDATGTAHWFSGSQLATLRPGPTPGTWVGDSAYLANHADHLLYWNNRELATSAPVPVATYAATSTTHPTPYNPQSRAPFTIHGNLSMPTAVADPTDGSIYCVFSQLMPATVPNEPGRFRDLYLQKLSFPGANQVQAHVPRNISRELRGLPLGAAAMGFDCVFPSAAPAIENGLLHYQWLSDTLPGLNQWNGGPVSTAAILLDTIQVGGTAFQPWRLFGGPTGLSAAALAPDVQLAPNPTGGLATVRLTGSAATTATLSVRDVLGRVVLAPAPHQLAAGSAAVPLDLRNQPAGVYLVTVDVGGIQTVRRLLKQ